MAAQQNQRGEMPQPLPIQKLLLELCWESNMTHASVQSGERIRSMAQSIPISANSESLERRIGLRSAVLFNMLEMIGVGPFITLPLVIAAAGYRLSVWAWVLGAVIAVADGLVWAELGRGISHGGRVLCVSARDLRSQRRRQLAQLSLRVAVKLFRAAFDCLRLHRAVEFSRLVLAGAGLGADRRVAGVCTTPTSPPLAHACW